MSQRNGFSPVRPKAQRSSAVLNDLKRVTGGVGGNNRQFGSQQQTSGRAVPVTGGQSRISNLSVNSGGSAKMKKSSTAVGRMRSNSNVSKQSKKKQLATKTYDPIRLPEDILTIQAHTVSTPVTELPYLLIAAHIAALPTARQFYPPTSATPTPLTVFRDMFVMTVDVRGYKPKSVRLSTEGQLIIIECLQTEVPQVVFTQTGTVDSSDQYVMDPPPNLSSMPVHTSFSYVQHRVKLPDDFSEEGLKVGMDDVSGHVIITGRLVHDQKSSFPEPWNKNKIVKKIKGPLVNTSCSNLSKEDARKLAAFHAVQGTDSNEKAHELVHTGLLVYGKKQWLEREGAKLRAIQHKALKESIRRLTESKKGTGRKSSKPSLKHGKHVRSQQEKSEEGSSEGQTGQAGALAGTSAEDPSPAPVPTATTNEGSEDKQSESTEEAKQMTSSEDSHAVNNDARTPLSGEREKEPSPAILPAQPTDHSEEENPSHLNTTKALNETERKAGEPPQPEAVTTQSADEDAGSSAMGLKESPGILTIAENPTQEADETELIEKQDKLMWEKLLLYAGVKGKPTPNHRPVSD